MITSAQPESVPDSTPDNSTPETKTVPYANAIEQVATTEDPAVLRELLTQIGINHRMHLIDEETFEVTSARCELKIDIFSATNPAESGALQMRVEKAYRDGIISIDERQTWLDRVMKVRHNHFRPPLLATDLQQKFHEDVERANLLNPGDSQFSIS